MVTFSHWPFGRLYRLDLGRKRGLVDRFPRHCYLTLPLSHAFSPLAFVRGVAMGWVLSTGADRGTRWGCVLSVGLARGTREGWVLSTGAARGTRWGWVLSVGLGAGVAGVDMTYFFFLWARSHA